MSDNFYMFALNAWVAQLLNKVTGIGIGANNLVEQNGYRNRRSIAGEVWL